MSKSTTKKDEALERLQQSVDALAEKAKADTSSRLEQAKAVAEAAANPALIGGALLGVFGMGMLWYARRSRKPRRTQLILRQGGSKDPVVGLLAEAGKLVLKKALKS